MREILYRGKCKNNGRWFEGVPFQTNYDGFKTWCISTEPLCANEYSEILGDWAEVIPETIGQYTGLTDKNGKRIFEGDILQYDAYNRQYVGFVEYNTAEFGVNSENASPFLSTAVVKYCATVIGNIHDNPELLRGDENNDPKGGIKNH